MKTQNKVLKKVSLKKKHKKAFTKQNEMKQTTFITEN